MPSRADVAVPGAAASDMPLRLAGTLLHGVAIVCVALALWRLLTPASRTPPTAQVTPNGTLSAVMPLTGDTMRVAVDGVPSATTRALLRAWRGSGMPVALTAAAALPSLAVASESEWRQAGGTRVQIAASDSMAAAISDAAGVLDSQRVTQTGVQIRTGPLAGALTAAGRTVHAAGVPLRAGAPSVARVLIVGDATWESRFVAAALEEAGWPVDLAVTLSPKVTIASGAARTPSLAVHAAVVVLPGAPTVLVSALPAFVRNGGGVIIVGEAARLPGIAALRSGAPGPMQDGELGAEASDEPRHGLELTPIVSLAPGAVALESRDGQRAIAARRVGAGRVLQVGYGNSWLWRMAGADAAPEAHRRWWTALVSGVVAQRAPVLPQPLAEHDTLDAAPLAAMAATLGLPTIGVSSVQSATPSRVSSLDLRWLMLIAVSALVVSWVLRRWRGLA